MPKRMQRKKKLVKVSLRKIRRIEKLAEEIDWVTDYNDDPTLVSVSRNLNNAVKRLLEDVDDDL